MAKVQPKTTTVPPPAYSDDFNKKKEHVKACLNLGNQRLELIDQVIQLDRVTDNLSRIIMGCTDDGITSGLFKRSNSCNRFSGNTSEVLDRISDELNEAKKDIRRLSNRERAKSQNEKEMVSSANFFDQNKLRIANILMNQRTLENQQTLNELKLKMFTIGYFQHFTLETEKLLGKLDQLGKQSFDLGCSDPVK